MDAKDAISSRIKEARARLGLSQQKFGDAMGVSQRTISDYEAGRTLPGAAELAMLAGLGIDIAWLLTGVSANVDGGRGVRARVDKDLWKQVRRLVKDTYAAEGVRLPDTIMDDIILSKYNILVRLEPSSEEVQSALAVIRAQLLEEMDSDHPDAAQTKDRA